VWCSIDGGVHSGRLHTSLSRTQDVVSDGYDDDSAAVCRHGVTDTDVAAAVITAASCCLPAGRCDTTSGSAAVFTARTCTGLHTRRRTALSRHVYVTAANCCPSSQLSHDHQDPRWSLLHTAAARQVHSLLTSLRLDSQHIAAILVITCVSLTVMGK